MNQYQYQQPIRWGLIIVWLIFFFPVGLYFLVREYRQKRNLYEYGKMLKTTGIVCIGIGIFYVFFMLLVPLTSTDGSATTFAEKLGLGIMMLIVFGSIGIAFFLSGIKKLKQAAQQNNLNQSAEFEANHPFADANCPNCGAHIRARKGIAAQCEYCGSQYTVD